MQGLEIYFVPYNWNQIDFIIVTLPDQEQTQGDEPLNIYCNLISHTEKNTFWY